MQGLGVVNGDTFEQMVERLRERGLNKAEYACKVMKAQLPPPRDLDPVRALETITAK